MFNIRKKVEQDNQKLGKELQEQIEFVKAEKKHIANLKASSDMSKKH